MVDPDKSWVKQTHVYDQQGGVNRITFSSIEINKPVANSKFEFRPPKGTRILKP